MCVSRGGKTATAIEAPGHDLPQSATMPECTARSAPSLIKALASPRAAHPPAPSFVLLPPQKPPLAPSPD
ncbi:hypothetical protein RR48_10728 [Papilio machaon]|uniref:Uncharacterized protein n=1 Tax=Papilio machaon TaxID=76193 RepID=A0A194R7Q4_PAPMA|nr:hypothetical protein RR48_10728 [Papilio machaon]